MRLLLAVAEDLYTFGAQAVINFFRSQSGSQSLSLRQENSIIELPGAQADRLVSENTEYDLEVPLEEGEIEMPPTFRSAAEILDYDTARPVKNTVMYIGSTDAPLFKNPTVEFDGVIGRVSYGTMVMALESRGRWSKIVVDGREGWVLRDDLSDRSAHVYPDFTIGEQNDVEDPNTIRLRTIIKDEFSAGEADLPLLSSEYVLYRLYRKGLRISWPNIRPRTEGMWHTILKGATGIHIGIQPKTGSVMEYELENGLGHLAYVEAVFPDETINISETNYPDRGIYNERTLTREEWRELKPVFIQVT